MQYSNFSNGFEAFFVDSLRTISHKELPALPPFIRFDKVQCFYDWSCSRSVVLLDFPPSSPAIDKKCQMFRKHLQSLKPALNDLNLVRFTGCICEFYFSLSAFKDHFALLKHLRDELLPICDSSRNYEFYILFITDKDSHTNVIESLLQMPQMRRSNVGIEFNCVYDSQLPVETIVQWLNQEPDQNDVIYRKKQQEKCLTIKLSSINNILRMCRRSVEVFVEFLS